MTGFSSMMSMVGIGSGSRAGGKASGGGKGKPNGKGKGKTSAGKSMGKGPPSVEDGALSDDGAGLGLGSSASTVSSASHVLPSRVDKASSEKDRASSSRASVASYVVDAPSGALQELVTVIRSVEKIQVAWRSYKADQRMPRENQRVTVVCDVLDGVDMPNVNRFGGCDPFVECRVVRGNPQGDVDTEPVLTSQTDVKRNDMSPSWRQRLALVDLTFEKGLYIQLILWDYNLVRNQPIGQVAIPLERAIAAFSPKRPERFLSFSSSTGEELSLRAKVSAQFTFWEAHQHRLVVESGSWLPKVKMLGAISSYVEARVLQSDPRKASFHARPLAPECIWSGRTGVVSENVDPCWLQEFNFTLAYDVTSLWLQLILWDTSAPQPDVPIGHAIMEISEAQSGSIKELAIHELSLEELPQSHVSADLSRAKLAIRMGHVAL